MSQMGSMAAQLPMQLGQAVMAVPQQMGQQLQQLSQPLQQLTSMFGQGGRADSLGSAGLPFSSFSNHPHAKDEQATQAHEPQREEREPLHRAEANDRAMAGPSASDDKHGPAPVKSPEHQQHRGEGDLGRRL